MIQTCGNCFFSEISLRSGSYYLSQNDAGQIAEHKLWCWVYREHKHRKEKCVEWLDKTTEGDPKKVAINTSEKRIKEPGQ